MIITEKLSIVAKKDGSIITIIDGDSNPVTEPALIKDCAEVYNHCRDIDDVAVKTAWFNEQIADGKFTELASKCSITAEPAEPVVVDPKDTVKGGIQKLMDFFKEFEFEPNFRFVNTLALMITKKKSFATDYINSYFELIDSPYKNEITAKIKSKEFKAILADIGAVAPTKVVNQRFKLYYGSQGTGKTTIGQRESDGRCIVCNASMLPADLMEDFGFDDGKAGFNRSILWECMENGKPIVLDEINLLPFDSLRFLQGILDGKKEFNYKGQTVHINDGFMVIGTMNLAVNGMVYALPEPLVDRCMETKKFALTAKDLMGAVM